MTIYVATSEGLYVSSGSELARFLDEPVAALARRPVPNPSVVVGVTDAWDLVDVEEAAFSVIRTETPLGHEHPTCIGALEGTRGIGTIIATTRAHVVTAPAGEDVRFTLNEPFDALDDRDTWKQPWGAPGDSRTVAVLPDDTMLVNVHVGGVLRSDDGGASWTQLVDVNVDVHEVAIGGPDTLVVATGARGFGVSRDRGDTWAFSTRGLHGGYCRAVAVVGDDVLVSTSDGPFTDDGRLYRRSLHDDAAPFTPVEGGLPTFEGNLDSRLLSSHPHLPDVALAAPDGMVYASADAGHTWAVVGSVPGELRALVVA